MTLSQQLIESGSGVFDFLAERFDSDLELGLLLVNHQSFGFKFLHQEFQLFKT